jgi:LmbE family N-acetylglucosaminyl deacetylase
MTNHSTVLIVAAHPDDEVLGCGGTIARLSNDGVDVHVLILADGESSRIGEADYAACRAARVKASRAALDILGVKSVEMHELPDNQLDSVELIRVVRLIEDCIARLRPSAVFTHHAGDVNVDHQVAHNATIVACRPQPGHPAKELLFFEVPSSTEWRPATSGMQFAPSWFVDISATLDRKLQAMAAYGEELREFPHPRSLDALTALARWRGASVGVNAAEAFALGRKIVS